MHKKAQRRGRERILSSKQLIGIANSGTQIELFTDKCCKGRAYPYCRKGFIHLMGWLIPHKSCMYLSVTLLLFLVLCCSYWLRGVTHPNWTDARWKGLREKLMILNWWISISSSEKVIYHKPISHSQNKSQRNNNQLILTLSTCNWHNRWELKYITRLVFGWKKINWRVSCLTV